MQNHAYNRLGSFGSGGGATPSPPSSPRRSPRIHRRQAKLGGGGGARLVQPPRSLAQRAALALLTILLRRQAYSSSHRFSTSRRCSSTWAPSPSIACRASSPAPPRAPCTGALTSTSASARHERR
uniref:Uncharacterized protein n=1 Tax=Ananas comosus var. bracteatus TaxID=296719 RepID=A0A6V7QYS6_ANACO